VSEPDATLIFATGNVAKLNQLRYLIAAYGMAVSVVAAADLYGDAGHYEELGASPEEIVAAGARAVAARIGRPVLAEDSVFEVDALEGQPGLRAGAYLKRHGREGILRALQGQTDRRAFIRSAVALAEPGQEPWVWSRSIAGRVTLEERWMPNLPGWIAPSPEAPLGGGYNAIFVPEGESRTLAEIPPAEGLELGYREPLFYQALKHFLDDWGHNQS
jgi:XTP/dITP diphosphohydrolase